MTESAESDCLEITYIVFYLVGTSTLNESTIDLAITLQDCRRAIAARKYYTKVGYVIILIGCKKGIRHSAF